MAKSSGDSQRQLPLFAIFVHYTLEPDEAKNPIASGLPGRLRGDLEYLNRLLQPDNGWQGFAFVFIDRGWTDYVSLNTDPAKAQWTFQEAFDLGLELGALRMHWEVHPELEKGRIRLITLADLRKFTNTLRETLPPEDKGKLAQYLVGERDTLLYDAPKVIEAAIRIANIGRQIPILRFDDDVIFHGVRHPNLEDPGAEEARARDSIERLCKEYKRLTDDPEISYFVFSGSYLDAETTNRFEQPASNLGKGKNDLCHALNGFATRAMQLAQEDVDRTKEVVVSLGKLQDPKDSQPFQKKRDKLLEDTPVAISAKAIGDFMRGLDKFGANPFLQVISGAGLCLSDGAILDLPPFSNMRQNVVWIDDHLKYSLHHELHHFGFCKDKQHVARVVEAPFAQARHPDPIAKQVNLYNVRWHVCNYLPRLLLGCIADAWLRADVKLKHKLQDLDDKEFEDLFENVPKEYAKEFFDVVTRGWPDDDGESKAKLEATLWRIAKKRLTELTEFFQLAIFKNTFLRLFAAGPGQEWADPWDKLGFSRSIVPEGLARAVDSLPDDAPKGNREADGENATSDLSLADSVQMLIEDFLQYMSFCAFWRHFVVSARSLLNRKERRGEALWLLPEPLPPSSGPPAAPLTDTILSIVDDLQSNEPRQQRRGAGEFRTYMSLVGKRVPDEIDEEIDRLLKEGANSPIEWNPLLNYILNSVIPDLPMRVLRLLEEAEDESVRNAASELLRMLDE